MPELLVIVVTSLQRIVSFQLRRFQNLAYSLHESRSFTPEANRSGLWFANRNQREVLLFIEASPMGHPTPRSPLPYTSAKITPPSI